MKEGKDLPGFFRKREILHGDKSTPAAMSRQGAEMAARGLLDEALIFYIKADDADGIGKVLEESRKEGDAFSFEAALRALGRSASHDEWKDVASAAMRSGRWKFAYRAFEKADDQDGLEEVRRLMGGEGSGAGETVEAP